MLMLMLLPLPPLPLPLPPPLLPLLPPLLPLPPPPVPARTQASPRKKHREPRRGDPPNTAAPTPPRGPVPASDVAMRPAPPDVAVGPVVELAAHNVITVRRWGRVLDGDVFAISPRIPWTELLRRTYGIPWASPSQSSPTRSLPTSRSRAPEAGARS